MVGLVEAATKDSTDHVLGMITKMREELGTLAGRAAGSSNRFGAGSRFRNYHR